MFCNFIIAQMPTLSVKFSPIMPDLFLKVDIQSRNYLLILENSRLITALYTPAGFQLGILELVYPKL